MNEHYPCELLIDGTRLEVTYKISFHNFEELSRRIKFCFNTMKHFALVLTRFLNWQSSEPLTALTPFVTFSRVEKVKQDEEMKQEAVTQYAVGAILK